MFEHVTYDKIGTSVGKSVSNFQKFLLSHIQNTLNVVENDISHFNCTGDELEGERQDYGLRVSFIFGPSLAYIESFVTPEPKGIKGHFFLWHRDLNQDI